MNLSRRRFGAALATGLAGTAQAQLTLPQRPKLLVLLVAEQFRSDYLDRYARLLGSEGFRLLAGKGSYFPNCHCRASTFTSSALATLSTGAYPALHGIVADAWYNPADSATVNADLAACQASVLADRISEDPLNRVYAIGLEREHTRLLAGYSARSVFSLEQYVSSDLYVNRRWTAIDAPPDAPPLRTLKFDATRPEEFQTLFRASPFAQTAQFDFAKSLVRKHRLGRVSGLDCLILSLGSMERLGYEVGAESPLMREMILHLDREIAALLSFLAETAGDGGYEVVFTAAHGAPREPDKEARPTLAIRGEAVASAIDQALSAALDVSSLKHRYVERYVYPFVYLRRPLLRRLGIGLSEARRLAGEAALRIPGVAGYYTADSECSHRGDWLTRFENSFHAQHSGDLMLAYRPHTVEEYGAGRGISYGSFYNYDSLVPLVFYGNRFPAQTLHTIVELADVAPTLAHAYGVSMPSSATGRVLGEIFKRESGKKE
ncbi:MAG: alkaline phosphatase family protein [Bryobacteraceae bacterium]